MTLTHYFWRDNTVTGRRDYRWGIKYTTSPPMITSREAEGGRKEEIEEGEKEEQGKNKNVSVGSYALC